MFPIRPALLILVTSILALAASCGGGGGDSGGNTGGTTICLNCSGLSGNARLLCLIQNSGRPGCDDPPSGDPPPNAISAFALASPAVPGRLGAGGTIGVTVPDGTDVSSLVAVFDVSGPPGAGVAVSGVQQTSGVTANDFSAPVTYSVIPATGATNRHVVTVRVAPATNIWTWVGGSSGTDQAGTYGAKGSATPTQVPGARRDAVSWVDANGVFWLFGGYGLDAAGASWRLNDLWKFDGALWTWVGGSDTINQPGVYGVRNTPAAANAPGAREGAAAWKDRGGNLWLFGGYGVDASGSFGWLNDLWRFDGSNWTWVGGSNLANPAAVYGTKGTAASANVPDGRNGAVSWRDEADNVWVFGGTGARGELNDLWKFDGADWTWVSGASTPSQSGVYGSLGIAAATNVPGARQKAVSWIDASGHLLLFGGTGYASGGQHGLLNDLWKFDGANWTWISGSSLADRAGTYGSVGIPAAANTPGARKGSAAWSDAAGRLWLLGGAGVDVNGSPSAVLHDLWRFDGARWTWIGGSGFTGGVDTYGAKGLAIVDSPYGRSGGVVWTEASGKVWLFGGDRGGLLNDLMRYQP